MYKIIGANQVEYGPVTAEQLRQWIAEGRVNAQTSAQAVGDTAWKPISSFPEFAASFPGSTVPPSSFPGVPPPLGAASPFLTTDAGRAQALNEVSGPAIGLMITGGLGIAGAILNILASIFGIALGSFDRVRTFNLRGQNPEMMRFMEMTNGVGGIFLHLITIGLGVFIIYAALKMKRLESHGLCIAASILALIPCCSPCCCIGIPIGIWALIVLNKPEVKAYFN